jgi:hypothetical protein
VSCVNVLNYLSMAQEKSQTKNLEKTIQGLTKVIDKQNSYWRRFLIGLVFGTGTAIGATIFAGLIIYLFSILVGSSDIAPFLQIGT